MDIKQLIDSITPEIYENLKRSIELGKWPDGRGLSQEQKEHSMQAIIAYEEKHKTPEERTGYVPPKPKKAEPCDKDGKDEVVMPNAEQPLKWQ